MVVGFWEKELLLIAFQHLSFKIQVFINSSYSFVRIQRPTLYSKTKDHTVNTKTNSTCKDEDTYLQSIQRPTLSQSRPILEKPRSIPHAKVKTHARNIILRPILEILRPILSQLRAMLEILRPGAHRNSKPSKLVPFFFFPAVVSRIYGGLVGSMVLESGERHLW